MSENLTLAQQIDADLKSAMLARDETAKLTLRSVKTALSAATKTEDAPQVDDALVQSVLQREAKRRRDAAAEYEKAGSPERAAQELAELAGLDDAAFRALFSKSPVKRIGRNRFVRNVLYAIGNSGCADLVQIAQSLAYDPDAAVQDAARWAVMRLRAADGEASGSGV